MCGLLVAVALLFCIGALTLGLFYYTAGRYEVEFLPALVLLAVIGMLSLERALAPTSESGQACRPFWRRVVRWGWGLLLAFSVAFNLFASVERCAEAHNNLGGVLYQAGQREEAMAQYEQALRLKPDFAAAHYNLGVGLARTGRLQEAIGHYEDALRINPDYAEAHYNLGVALIRLGRAQEAIGHWEQAVRIRPDFVEARYNWGVALEKLGRRPEAIEQYEQALKLRPDLTAAKDALARLQNRQ